MNITEKPKQVKPTPTLERAADGLYALIGELEQRISTHCDLIGMVKDAQHQLADHPND